MSEHEEQIAGLLPQGLPAEELLSTQDFARNFRLAERVPADAGHGGHLLLLHWSGAVVRVPLEAGKLGRYEVVRVRRVPPRGARPGRGDMPIPARTWGEAQVVLRDDGAVETWSDALPDELEVHADTRRGPAVYRFAIGDPRTLDARDPTDLGPGRSRLYDGVGWVLFAEKLEDAGQAADPVVAAAYEQALRFVEGDGLPDRRDAYLASSTHALARDWPARFSRVALERRRDLARQRAAAT